MNHRGLKPYFPFQNFARFLFWASVCLLTTHCPKKDDPEGSTDCLSRSAACTVGQLPGLPGTGEAVYGAIYTEIAYNHIKKEMVIIAYVKDAGKELLVYESLLGFVADVLKITPFGLNYIAKVKEPVYNKILEPTVIVNPSLVTTVVELAVADYPVDSTHNEPRRLIFYSYLDPFHPNEPYYLTDVNGGSPTPCEKVWDDATTSGFYCSEISRWITISSNQFNDGTNLWSNTCEIAEGSVGTNGEKFVSGSPTSSGCIWQGGADHN